MSKTAVLIDAENLSHRCLAPIFQDLESNNHQIKLKQAFADWSLPELAIDAWKKALNSFSIKPVHLFNYSTGKNASDIQMVIAGMHMLYTDPDISTFVIVTGDSDFTPFVMHLKELGKNVIGYSGENSAKSLRNACDEFTPISVKSKDNNDDKKKSDLNETCFNVWRDCFWLRNQKGWIKMDVFGERLKEQIQSSWKKHGYKTLKELVANQSNLETKELKNGIHVRPIITGDDWIYVSMERSYPFLTSIESPFIDIELMVHHIDQQFAKPKKLQNYSTLFLVENNPLFTKNDNNQIVRYMSEKEIKLNQFFVDKCRENETQVFSFYESEKNDIKEQMKALFTEYKFIKSYDITALIEMCSFLRLSTEETENELLFHVQEWKNFSR